MVGRSRCSVDTLRPWLVCAGGVEGFTDELGQLQLLRLIKLVVGVYNGDLPTGNSIVAVKDYRAEYSLLEVSFHCVTG
jgi:hypothetical protein